MFDVFSPHLKRTQLLQASRTVQKGKKFKINVYRNHAFEPVASIIQPFLQFSNLFIEFILSDYDDSLTLNLEDADLTLIWLDLSRYKQAWKPHIDQQVQKLQKQTKSPLIVIFMDILNPIKNLEFSYPTILLSQLLNSAPHPLDLIKEPISGTKLSNSSCINIAQYLGLKIIPTFLLPALKAIILDLDNTLYRGILGEDGIEGIVLTPQHRQLQEKILTYKHNGFLLALCSKNEEKDARELFLKRKDFALKWEDFDAFKINWQEKTQNILEIANQFNIGLDSMLFIDDNIAEIEHAKMLPIKTILATHPQEVLRILELFPQMDKAFITEEDALRSKDIRANELRKQMQTLSQEQYFQNLAMTLTIEWNDTKHLHRITELLNKTNQFISNYTRPTLTQVEAIIQNPNQGIVSIAMSDKLSDSGIIAIFIGQKHSTHLELLDLCVSCRALGRKLEKIMLTKAIDHFKSHLQISGKTIIDYQQGERNQPFLDFLKKLDYDYKSETTITIDELKIDTSGLRIIE